LKLSLCGRDSNT
jgi:hypothetical protein